VIHHAAHQALQGFYQSAGIAPQIQGKRLVFACVLDQMIHFVIRHEELGHFSYQQGIGKVNQLLAVLAVAVLLVAHQLPIVVVVSQIQ